MCPPRRLPSVVLMVALFAAVTGCAGYGNRPDAEVARAVRLEEERRAPSAALAAADVEALQLTPAGVAIETMGLLYVPPARHEPAPPARAPAEAGWLHGPPAALRSHPLLMRLDGSSSDQAEAHDGSDEESEGVVDEGSRRGRRRSGATKKPRFKFDVLDVKINDNPIKMDVTVRDLKSVEFSWTLRM